MCHVLVGITPGFVAQRFLLRKPDHFRTLLGCLQHVTGCYFPSVSCVYICANFTVLCTRLSTTSEHLISNWNDANLELYTIPVSNFVPMVVLQYLSVRKPVRNFFSQATARFVISK